MTPVPVTKPHPLFFIGGMSKVAVRRAAKFGLPILPPRATPDLEKYYREELARNGKTGFVYYPDQENSMIFIDESPERAWRELAPFFFREVQEYSGWNQERTPEWREQETRTIEDLRAQKRYVILTPDQCIERFRKLGKRCTPVLHPLAGGIPLERAWKSLELYVDRVIEPLAGEDPD